MAHRKLGQKPRDHTKQNTSTWPTNKSPAMCKAGHEHAANEKTHKPRVHTRQHESTQPMNIQAACHTAQDIT